MSKQKTTTRFQTQERKVSTLQSRVISWLGAITVIAGFFVIQVKLDQLPKDWAHTTLLYVSVFVEFGLLGLLNSLFP